METDSSSEKLTFDWCEREIKYYKNRAAECLTLKFVEKPNQKFDRFKWYILVALAPKQASSLGLARGQAAGFTGTYRPSPSLPAG